MRRKAAKWARQALAYTLIICMLVSMAPTSYAMEAGEALTIIGESEASNSITKTEVEPAIKGGTELSSEETSLNQETGTGTENSGDTTPKEENTPNVDTIPENETKTSEGEEILSEDQGLGVETKEVTDNNSANEADDVADSEVLTAEENSPVFLAGVDAQSTAGLTLDEVIQLANAYKTEHSELKHSPIVKINESTLNVYNGEGLILLSQANPAEYQSKNLVLLVQGGSSWDTITDITVGEITYTYQGLGSEVLPFLGTISIDNTANGFSIQTKQSLFRAISTEATVGTPISFSLVQEMDQPLFAEQVICGSDSTKVLTFTVSLNVPNENDPAKKIGGILGTLQSNAKAAMTVINTCTSALTVSGTSNIGLFCNEMETGAELIANFESSQSVTVSSTGGDAGGFVGHMAGNNTLTFSGVSINEVTSQSRNAGGLVGSATNATIQVTPDESFSFSNISVAAGNNAGGMIGEYTNQKSEAQNLRLDTYYGNDTMITLSAGSNAGGVFGAFQNSGSYTIGEGLVSSILSGGTTYGGLIGTYEAQENGDILARNATLTILNITGENKITSTGGNNATTYGGAIGMVSGSSYVEIKNVSVSTEEMPYGGSTYFGGLVGQMVNGLLNVGDVKLISNKDIAADDVGGRGGLVGYIVKGALRLHGTTDLSNQIITTAYHHTGQIVGNNGSGLVYAVGNGSNATAEGTGWTLKRYSGTRSGSDIGNWGEVVRLDGTTLKETTGTDETALFKFDTTAHTVTVQGTTTNDNGITIEGTRDFVAYALAYSLNSGTDYGTTSSDSNILIFPNPIIWNDLQNVQLTGDVDLSNTGILGIGRDDRNDNNRQPFTGTFNGNNRTIKVDIGCTYGKVGDNEVSTDSDGSGQIYTRRASSREGHICLALFPYTNNATINKLEVEGSVRCLIAKKGNNGDVKWPVIAAGVVGNADGQTTFNSVIVNADISVASEDDTSESKTLYVLQAGILGRYTGGDILSFTNCSWTSTLTNTRSTSNTFIGGFVGNLHGSSEVEVTGCTLSGKINAEKISNTTARVGGLFAESRKERQDNNGNFSSKNEKINIISISALKMNGVEINTSASANSGGFLGYSWRETDVILGTNASTDGSGNTVPATGGVAISGCILNAGSNGKFGGLLYQATGHWDATAANSILFTMDTDGNVNSFTGKTGEQGISALLVADGIDNSNVNDIKAIYLEVGTFGKENTAYYIQPGAVSLKLNETVVTSETKDKIFFDELVGWTEVNPAGHCNGVISLNTGDPNGMIDTDSTPDTYTSQVASGVNFKSSYTRYYYNICNEETQITTLTTPQQIVTWSASQYAASNIRENLFAGCDDEVAIMGKGDNGIDLTNYSYYPVTPRKQVTVEGADLTFGYDKIQNQERNNKKPSDNKHQHYLMQHGLLYNTESNVTVNDTTFSGTVGLQSVSNTTNSGALIFGNATGTDQSSIKVSLDTVKLTGLRVSGVDGSTAYAPLLINTMGQELTLTVKDLSTETGYVGIDGTTAYAATSLIGNVGSSSAVKLYLTFSNIALDSRINADGNNFVWNNGESKNHKVEYNTTRTIFTHATLLESFRYSADSSGVYNFNSNDTQVTYGVEISNTNSGRNQKKQYEYYDGGYVWDGLGDSATTADTIAAYFATTNYVRYVHVQEGEEGGYHELDINQKATGLTTGCGTYGDPYIITDGQQLIDLARFINKQTDVEGFQVSFNTDVLTAQKQVKESYHTNGVDKGKDVIYTWDGSTWSIGTDSTTDTIDNKKALTYLLNAYYKIQGEITIPLEAGTYQGLGSKENPFSGVITGGTVYLTGTMTIQSDFGGLIRFSRGSVVKDMTVNFTGASITLNNTAGKPTSSNIRFFGGIVGYCMGGDTIIDGVSVNYKSDSVVVGADINDRMIPVGGLVGLVGGVVDIDNSYLEKTGGGVVFRGSLVNNFASVQTKTSNSGDGATYFYCNPYVGRVLDGYACYEGGTPGQSTLNNTNKNYTIPDIEVRTTDLEVDASFNAKVNSAQGLWLLSAIVNSGASAMDSTGKYTEYDSTYTVDAYQYGKPRTADYDNIGAKLTDDTQKEAALADETCWGGVLSGTEGADKTRVSYLIKKYTNITGDTYYAAMLTGKGSSDDVNNIVNLSFPAKTIDMATYGNGFRGIGASYGYVRNDGIYNEKDISSYQRIMRRSIYAAKIIKEINSAQESETAQSDSYTTINLDMEQKVYLNESPRADDSWSNHGVGLFTNLGLPIGGCSVENLKLTGSIAIKYFEDDGSTQGKSDKIMGESGAGSFAAKTLYNGTLLTFNNLSLSNLIVSGAANTGGAIGSVNRNSVSVVFSSVKATDVTVLSIFNEDGNVGGIVGYFAPQGGGSCTIGSSGTNSTFENISVSISGNASQWVAAGGLIGKCEKRNFVIQNCEIAGNNTVSVSKSKQCGGLIGCAGGGGTIKDVNVSGIKITNNGTVGTGGLVGESQANVTDLTIEKVTIGSEGAPVVVYNNNSNNNDCRTGGMVGYLNGGKKASIKNCTAKHLYVLSKSRCGGLVGYHSYNSLSVSNVALSNVIVAVFDQNGKVGLLVGESNNKPTSGYNILANSCKVGYNSALTDENLRTSSLEEKTYTAIWVGANGSGTANLVAVAVKDGTLPNKDIGSNSGSASFVYADYPVDQNYNPNGTNGTPQSANPWLAVNPKSNVVVKDSVNAASSTTLTGNGVGYLTVQNEAGTYDSVAKTILTEAKNATSTSVRRYFNIPSGTDTDLAKLLVNSNDIYLTGYQEEEKGTTNVPEGVNLPILVVNSTADANTAIWKYIATLTNVADGETAKGQVLSITAATYKWELPEGETDANEGSFIKQNSSSLSVSDKTISITPKAYDNQKSQFTLLDVRYADPTGNNTYGLHLYVPILIKRVLEAKLSVKFLAGTNYRADAYTDVKNYATADFGEPVTAYIEYNYNRSGEEWQAMLDQGENLLWSYSKILDLAKGNSSASPLPAGTRLTLVDRQTGKSYTHTLKEGDNVHSLDLSVLKDSQGTGFVSVPVCDLLGITCASYSESGTAYVKESDPAKATVKIGDSYYRMATSEDTAEKFTLTVNEQIPSVAGANNYLPQGEGYYFTIQVPKPESVENITINNNLNQSSEALKSDNGAPAAKIMQTYASNYVLYEGISQSFTQSSERLVSGNIKANNTEMENGDSIQVTLISQLNLTTEGQKHFANLGPEQVNHQFELAMQRFEQEVTTDTVIGAEGVTYTYQVTQGDTEIFSDSDTVHGSESRDVLELKYGSTDLKNALVAGTVTITATITMNYPLTGQYFPVRSNDTDQSGIMVKSVSKIANVASQLPITANKQNASDDNRFYTKNASNAKLSYFSYDKNGTSDATQQLGVNPSDDENNRSTMIYTQGDYDYSAISGEDLEKANKIRYTLELFCKDENGSYNENAPLGRMDEYLPEVKTEGGVTLDIASDKKSMTYEKEFAIDTVSYHDFVKINVVPLTGAEFEDEGFSYSNYKLRLTAVLLDEDGNEITVSKASDYIIYTNAKVYQHIFQ
ncbi:MAG: hypothetical protein ACI4FY_08625 [Acetatifactor sp.]